MSHCPPEQQVSVVTGTGQFTRQQNGVTMVGGGEHGPGKRLPPRNGTPSGSWGRRRAGRGGGGDGVSRMRRQQRP